MESVSADADFRETTAAGQDSVDYVHARWKAANQQCRTDFDLEYTVLCKRHIFSATECVSAVQGRPRSLIFAPIERAYATSY